MMDTMREADFERLYADNAQSLFGFLVYRTGDRALSEDLVADTFERALRARRLFDRRRATEKTWLYTIALNCLRDHARRRAAEGRALERAGPPAARHDPIGELDRIAGESDLTAALMALSEDEREALSLRFGADLTVPEIAKLTKEKLTTVEGRVYRALRKLRDELQPG
jgi:RNA polymerase sigma-70 factor, ECF subfamily